MARGSIVRNYDARLNGEHIGYVLHKIRGRRHVHLIIEEESGGVAVRAPYRFSRAEAEWLLQSNAEWVIRSLREARARNALRPRLVTGAALPLLDERLTLEVNPVEQGDLFENSTLAEGEVRRERDRLRVRTRAPDRGDLRPLLESWYRSRAKQELPARLRGFGGELGLWPERVSIRGQKTRWGSCSGNGGISLNWRLMLLGIELVDYVLVHELCHLRHLNHSVRFWRLVGSLIPDFRQREDRLREAQHQLPL